jgi:hypothetical protein
MNLALASVIIIAGLVVSRSPDLGIGNWIVGEGRAGNCATDDPNNLKATHWRL